MDFIDVQRLVFAVSAGAHPVPVGKLVGVQVPDDGGAGGPQLHAEAAGVAVVNKIVPVVNAVFVHHPRLGAVHVEGPEVAVVDPIHGDLLPAVELPDEGHPPGGGGEGAEGDARPLDMRAQVLVSVENFSCVEPVMIHGRTPSKDSGQVSVNLL